MRFGLIIRGQYPLGDDMRVRLKEDLDAAKFAEDLGYDVIGKGSHYSSHPFQYIQQIPYLCQVAMIAPKLRLCPGVVLLPLHSPLHVAEELASLDVMCDGKLIFGAGIGYREVEFKAFGSTQKQSGKRFEECLEAVKRLWSEDFVTMKAQLLRTRQRQLHGDAGAKADAAGVDRRQRQCRHPPRRARGRYVVHQPAQQDRYDRRADGGLQTRPRRGRQAVPRRTADGARGVRGADPRRGDPAGAARRWKPNTRPTRTGARTR